MKCRSALCSAWTGKNHLEPVNPLLHGEKLEKKYEKEEKEKTGL